MMPPLPEPFPAGYIAQTEYFFTADQIKEYGKACAAAERERLLQIVYEQATPFGTSGECIWIAVKSQVRHVPKTDWSAA
jgi:hypothetical protein